MNRSFAIQALAVALAFGAGYAVRGSGGDRDARGAGSDQVAANGRGDRRGSDGQERKTTDRERAAASMVPSGVALFTSGGAMSWLEGFGKMDSEDISALMRFCEQCRHLDTKSVEQLAVACLEAQRLLSADDPVTKGKFRENDLPENLFSLVVARLAELDPARALALMKSTGDDALSDSQITEIFGAVARQNPHLAQTALEGLDENLRENALQALVTGWCATDPAAALAMLDGMEKVGNLRTDCIRAMVATDPDLALSAAQDEAIKRKDFAALSWMVRENEEIRIRISDWLATYNGPDASALSSQALDFIVATDAEMGVSLYSRLASGMSEEEQVKAVRKITTALAEADSDHARQWIDGLSGAVKQAALASVTKEAISSIGKMTADNVDGIFKNQGDPHFAITYDKPLAPGTETAEAWLGQMQPSAEKNEATVLLVDRLQNVDPGRAIRWIETLPQGVQRDSLLRRTQLMMELNQVQVPAVSDLPVVDKLFHGGERAR